MGFQTILVPTDFSDNAQVAFEKACELARLLNATLHVLHVQDESSLRVAVKQGLLESCETDDQIQAAIGQLDEKRFARMSEQADCSGLEVTRLSRRGEAATQTLAYAKEIGADLIVMGRHGEGVVRNIIGAVLGTVAELILRKAPCPVLIVRREHRLKSA